MKHFKLNILDVKFKVVKGNNGGCKEVIALFTYSNKNFSYPLYIIARKNRIDALYVQEARKKFKELLDDGTIEEFVDIKLAQEEARLIAENKNKVEPDKDKKEEKDEKQEDDGNKKSGVVKNVIIGVLAAATIASTALAVYYGVFKNRTTPTSQDKIYVTFNADKGTFTKEKNNVKTIETTKGATFSTVKEKIKDDSVTYDGHTFLDWYIDDSKVEDSKVINQSIVVTAHYSINTVKITLDAGDGTWNGSEEPKAVGKFVTRELNYGTKWSEIKDDYLDKVTPPAAKTFKCFKISNQEIADTHPFYASEVLVAYFE